MEKVYTTKQAVWKCHTRNMYSRSTAWIMLKCHTFFRVLVRFNFSPTWIQSSLRHNSRTIF